MKITKWSTERFTVICKLSEKEMVLDWIVTHQHCSIIAQCEDRDSDAYTVVGERQQLWTWGQEARQNE